MADFVFNIALGRVRELSSLPATNDALIYMLIKATGLEADGTLRDYDDVGALFTAANDEADFTGYARRTLAGVTNTAPDDTNNRADSDANDPASYTNTGGAAQSIGKAIIAYDPDTTAGTDSSLVPLVAFDCVLTFDIGVATTTAFNASGFFRAQG